MFDWLGDIFSGIGNLLIGCGRRMVAVPIGFPVVLPNVDFPRKRVILIRRIATENIAEFEGFGVNFTIRAVNDFQPQCIVVISRPGIDELQFYPQFIINSTEERFAAVLRVTDDVAAAEQLFEFLFVEGHRSDLQDRPDIQKTRSV